MRILGFLNSWIPLLPLILPILLSCPTILLFCLFMERQRSQILGILILAALLLLAVCIRFYFRLG